MQCKVDRMQFEMNVLRWHRSGSSVIGSVRSQAPDRLPGRDEMRSARKHIMTTPVVSQPRGSSRHLLDASQRNVGPQMVFVKEQELRGSGFSRWGRPQRCGPATRRSCWSPGVTRRQLLRTRHGKHTRAVSDATCLFLWASWRSRVYTKLTPARKDADATTIPGLPGSFQLRYWNLSLRDTVASIRSPQRRGARILGHQACLRSLRGIVWGKVEGHRQHEKTVGSRGQAHEGATNLV